MSDDNEDLDPLDPVLGRLFREERSEPAFNPRANAKASAWAKLQGTLGPSDGGGDGGGGNGGGGGGTGSRSGVASTLGKWGAIKMAAPFIVGALVGGAVVIAVRPPRVEYVDRVIQPVAPTTTTVASMDAEVPVQIALTIPSSSPSSSSSPSPITGPSSSSTTHEALAAERAILDIARTALGRGDGAHALEATVRHAREFPRGQMAEEREAIEIQALALLGRKSEVEKNAERFRQRHPNSVFFPVIKAAEEKAAEGSNK